MNNFVTMAQGHNQNAPMRILQDAYCYNIREMTEFTEQHWQSQPRALGAGPAVVLERVD